MIGHPDNLTKRDLLNLLKTDTASWNALRAAHPHFRPDFSGENLHNAKLAGANLTNTNLSETGLIKANLEGANLEGANLREAKLNKANLEFANLHNAKELIEIQLSGTRLKGAMLPEGFEFKSLKTVEEASKNARGKFLLLISGTLYSVISSRVDHFQLITNSGLLELPFIGAKLPVMLFFFATPLILLFLFFYFHLYLEHLWKGLGQLPAVFPNGKSLDQAAYPWLLNGIVRSHYHWLKGSSSFRPLRRILRAILVWQFGIFIILPFWLNSLPRHHLPLTAWLLFLLFLAIFTGIVFQVNASRILLNRPISQPLYRAAWKWAAPPLIGAALLMAFSLNVISGGWKSSEFIYNLTKRLKVTHLFYADLYRSEFSKRPEDWANLCQREKNIELIKEARFSNRNFNYANMEKAFLPMAELSGSTFYGTKLDHAELFEADLSNSDLRRAQLNFTQMVKSNLKFSKLQHATLEKTNFSSAKMNDVNFTNANLQDAILSKASLKFTIFDYANMKAADLREADLEGARLTGAMLQSVQLTGAILTNAVFTQADLTGVDFRAVNLAQVDFSGAKLSNAMLEGAEAANAIFRKSNLRMARMKGCALVGAKMEGADLTGAKLINANLSGADLTGANFLYADITGALLYGANLRDCQNITLQQLQSACLDNRTILPEAFAAQAQELAVPCN